MSDNHSLVEEVLSLQSKNLNFFKKIYPGIYSFFSAYQLQNTKLDIQPQHAELDLIEHQKHVYGGAKQYAIKEVEHFLQVFDYGKTINSLKPLYQGDYKNPRFFAKHIDRIYQKSPLTKESYSGYELPNSFPLTVFMGCGLGLHIKSLIEQRDLKHVVLAETNMDRFFASFYAVDWEAIVSPYLASDERSFNFVLIPRSENEQQIRDVIWNHLIEYCPFFPVMTLFYNHLGSPIFDRIIDAINSDLYVHLFSFGNYDDEVNQLNNAIHNFKQEIMRLPLPRKEGFDLPVCIVGSGPSLDERINWLKEIQNDVIVISCGTALRALYKHGIKPDFQIELESDFNTYSTQNLNEDKDFMRSIKLIGAAQLTPKMFTLFDDKRLFFKAEGALPDMFASPGEAIKEAAPTCTNAALAFAFHFGFTDILLFGLDYGFPNKDEHHASGSIYYKENGPEGLKKATTHQDSDLIRVESASGGSILTTSFLYASKRKTENIIQTWKHPNVFNCSNGSKLQNTKWFNDETFRAIDFQKKLLNKQSVVDYLFSDDAVSVAQSVIDEALSGMKTQLVSMRDVFRAFLEQDIEDKNSMMTICYQMNKWLQQTLKPKNQSLYFFIRGTIWHFLHAGFSHSFALRNADESKVFVSIWQIEFKSFIDGLIEHFEGVIFKEFNLDTDLLTKRSISAPESGHPSLRLENNKWDYLGVILQDNGKYALYP